MTNLVVRLRHKNAGATTADAELMSEAADEIERLTAGLQLIAADEHRLMNVTARQTAASILSGKLIADEPPASPGKVDLAAFAKDADALMAKHGFTPMGGSGEPAACAHFSRDATNKCFDCGEQL